MGKDCILQISEYKQHIMDESICQLKDATSEYSDSSLIRQIATHPLVKDEKFLKMFLTANFGPNTATSILFGSFLQRQFTPGSLPTYSARREITYAESSFEVAARVFYSKEFIRNWIQYCSSYLDLWIHSLWFQMTFYCGQSKEPLISGGRL